jgi:hypothetical protein
VGKGRLCTRRYNQSDCGVGAGIAEKGDMVRLLVKIKRVQMQHPGQDPFCRGRRSMMRTVTYGSHQSQLRSRWRSPWLAAGVVPTRQRRLAGVRQGARTIVKHQGRAAGERHRAGRRRARGGWGQA